MMWWVGNIFSDEQGSDSLPLSSPHLLWLLLQSHFSALHAIITTLMHLVHCTAISNALVHSPLLGRRCSAMAIIRQYVGCHPECDVLYQPHFWDFLAMQLFPCNAADLLESFKTEKVAVNRTLKNQTDKERNIPFELRACNSFLSTKDKD